MGAKISIRGFPPMGRPPSSVKMLALANDESTWTSPIRATQEDLDVLTNTYVPKLCNSYVYEKYGGRTNVYLSAGGRNFYADNVTPHGRLVENKAAILSGGGTAQMQLSNYLRYLDENGGSLEYNFFKNPTGSRVGPNSQFASTLADATMKYDIRVNIYNHDWWDELQ
jgi:hypothetical protein